MPTGFTPIYQISKGGVDITGHFKDRTTAIRVDYSSGDGDDDKCFITLDDRDWKIARPALGETLDVKLGYAEVGLADMGQYTIKEITFGGVPKTITLGGLASGAFQALRTPITQEFDGKNLGEIFDELGRRAGIGVDVHPGLRLHKLEYKNIVTSVYQAAQEFARAYGAIAKVANGKLIVVPRDAGVSVSGQVIPTIVLGPAHFGTWSVRHSDVSAFGSVKTSYFDKDKNLRSFFEEKSPIEGAEQLGAFIPNRIFNSLAEAQAAAKAQMGAILRSRGNADLVLAKGDPWIKDQQKLLIRNMRDGVDGSYVIELVSHSYQADTGLSTAIKARPPSDGEDYEVLFDQASAEEQRAQFLDLGAGGLTGSILGQTLNTGAIPNIVNSLRLF